MSYAINQKQSASAQWLIYRRMPMKLFNLECIYLTTIIGSTRVFAFGVVATQPFPNSRGIFGFIELHAS
jgi:hypothetical protein